MLAVTAVVATVAFVGILTFYGADEFSGRAADARASNEAMSFAEHSSTLATGAAFDGYVQILRYVEDPILNTYSSPANARADALQRLVYLNTNKFSSLTVVDRSGIILATTDSTITTIRPSTAFSETRANLAPANSDIILPEAGRRGYVEYSAPLRDPSGTTWGILIGRADPATLWLGTLSATVDGSRNVIINSEGLFSAGVPDELLRQPWHGRPLANGGVRANIAGVDSICGLAPIGKGTQMDRGLNVASCLPASIIQIERRSATDKQGLITVAAAVLAVVIASLLLRVVMGGGEPVEQPAETAMVPPQDDQADEGSPTLEGLFASRVAAGAEAEPLPDVEPSDEGEIPVGESAAPYVPPRPDIDALTLIEAYERRNALLAERLRDTVQARLLIAATEAEEAFRLVEGDADAAATLHVHAMEELESIRKRELRSISQELYPGLTRMGLPGALKAMRKELRGIINVSLDLDATVDAVAGGASRASVAAPLRLVVYRFAMEAMRAFAGAGASACTIALHREGGELSLRVACDAADAGRGIDMGLLAASELAAEAYQGRSSFVEVDGKIVATLHVPAAPLAPGPVVELNLDEHDEESPNEMEASIRLAAVPGDDIAPDGGEAEAGASPPVVDVNVAPRTGLAAALEALQAEFFGSMIVALDIAPDVGELEAAGDILEAVATETLRALRAADARQCDMVLTRSGERIALRIVSDTLRGFDTMHIDAHERALEQAGGSLSIELDGGVAVTATTTAAATEVDEAHAPAGDGVLDAA